MTLEITRRDAAAAIDLLEGEEILHVTGRHWILLIVNLIPSVSIMLIALGLVVYRGVGGQFISIEPTSVPVIDTANRVLLALLTSMAAFWLFLRYQFPKQAGVRQWVLGFSVALALLVAFRALGGQLFRIDPFAATPFDLINGLLILVALVSAVMGVYTFFNWSNDELVLTNQRVIYDNDTVFIPRLLERRIQQQLPVREVQNVVARTETYLQHWFNYGTVVVQSANVGRKLVFNAANGPLEMQGKIMAEVRKLQGQRSEQNFENLIEAKVYNNAPPPPRRQFRLRRFTAPRALLWVLPENPEIDEAKGTITWRPHWLFLIQALLRPFALLAIGWVALIVAVRFGALDGLWATLSMVLILVAFVLWSLWEIEDYRNDLYILTPANVIDIEKKPFGPEDRRQAGLDRIQNVSFETTFIGNLLGYGNVLLETAGAGGKFTFIHVPNPRDVVATINEYLAEFRNGEKARSLDDALTLLRHYHAAQQRHNELRTDQP